MSMSVSICIAHKQHSASNAFDALNNAAWNRNVFMHSASEDGNVESMISQVVAQRVPHCRSKNFVWTSIIMFPAFHILEGPVPRSPGINVRECK